jgi:hypothetical protein
MCHRADEVTGWTNVRGRTKCHREDKVSQGRQSVTRKTNCQRVDKVSHGGQFVQWFYCRKKILGKYYKGTKCHRGTNCYRGRTVTKFKLAIITKGSSVTGSNCHKSYGKILQRDQLLQGLTVTKFGLVIITKGSSECHREHLGSLFWVQLSGFRVDEQFVHFWGQMSVCPNIFGVQYHSLLFYLGHCVTGSNCHIGRNVQGITSYGNCH